MFYVSARRGHESRAWRFHRQETAEVIALALMRAGWSRVRIDAA